MKNYINIALFSLVLSCPPSFATNVESCNKSLITLTRMEHNLIEYPETPDALVTLIQAELIHSAFFQECIQHLKNDLLNFNFKLPGQISLLTNEQMGKLANAIYAVMKDQFEGQGDLVQVLTAPRFSSKIFFQFPKQELVAKIGETLQIIGNEKSFYNAFASISARKELVLEPEGISAAIGFCGAIVCGALGILNYLAPITSELIFLNPTWQLAFGSSATLMVAPATSYYYRATRAAKNIYRNRIAAHKNVKGAIQFKETIFSYQLGNAGKALDEIERKALSLDFHYPNLDNLQTFGHAPVELHTDLNRFFVENLMKWMTVYERNQIQIRSRIEEIKAGDLDWRQTQRELFGFLSDMLHEASRTIVRSKDISGLITQLISQDLAALRKFQVDEDNVFAITDLQRRLHFLALSFTTHGQFLLFMTPLHRTISNLIETLESLALAESASIMKDLGSVSLDIDGNRSIENLIQGLMELDAFTSNIKRKKLEFTNPGVAVGL